MQSAGVVDSISVDVHSNPISTKVGVTNIPSAINYASVDAGAVFALPSGRVSGTSFEPWLVPYLGLNLYFVPVERVVPLDQLVGCTLLQRLSLTLGKPLSDPKVPGRTTASKPLGNYILTALGFRLNSYMRVTGGTLIYALESQNPASAAETWYLAPFVGGSLDWDIIHMFTAADI
jgi:hypothetical protein